MAQARLRGELSDADLTNLRIALSAVLTARIEADGLRAELESRGNKVESLSVYSLELECAINELEELDLLLVCILALPAFYKSGGVYGSAQIYKMSQGDTLESVAAALIPGVDNGAEAILQETPGFDPQTELTNDAIGAELNVPYDAYPPSDLVENSWVLDSQVGLKALGQGITNTWAIALSGNGLAVTWYGTWATAFAYGVGNAVAGVAGGDGAEHSYRCKTAHTSGASTQPGVGADWATVWSDVTVYQTLQVVAGVQNYAQAILNRLLTEVGSVDGFETFGSRVGGMIGRVLNPDISGEWGAAEAAQAAMADPRTAQVLAAKVDRDGDSLIVDLTVQPIHIMRGVRVTAAFSLPGA
jgi:hypothetical protein